jgi:hypothetical protein
VLPSASAGLADKSGAGAALTVYHGAISGTTATVATPRLNGLLGGLALNTMVSPNLLASGQQLQATDKDQGLISSAMQLGSGGGWPLYLVWSPPSYLTAPRPNHSQ